MRVLCALALCALARTALAQDVLVVTPDAFRPALKEWTAYREAQGLKVAVRAPGDDVKTTILALRKESGDELRFVLLLGDPAHVPCGYEPARAIKPYEKTSEIATDADLVDADGDGKPDLAVGRLPAANGKQAEALLAKSIAYERSGDFGDWRRRIEVTAGVGGFGPMFDALLEKVTRQSLDQSVPKPYVLEATYAKPSSVFCPPPAEIGDTFLHQINEGSFLVAYLGHGWRRGLDSLRYKDQRYPIFTETDVTSVQVEHGAPILCLIACSTGDFDQGTCLADELLRQKDGPVAVIASSRVSMPYANAVFALELLKAVFEKDVKTLGEAVETAKRKLPEKSPFEPWSLVYGNAESRRAERQEHVYLYNLLGDPCLRLPRPEPVALICPAEVARGGSLKISGKSACGAEVLVELAEGRLLPTPGRPSGDDSDAAFRKTYDRANNRVVASARVPVKKGAFTVTLKVPEDAQSGTYTVRAFASGKKAFALGAHILEIR